MEQCSPRLASTWVATPQVYLGIDVGFSAAVRSTGICVLDPASPAPVRCLHVKTQETIAAMRGLLGGARPVAASIDGPLAIRSSRYQLVNHYRRCEQLLSGGIFQRRCKPGSTNSPRGLALHKQATLLANRLKSLFPIIFIAEAFPNAFMGVMLPDRAYNGPIRRGIKSDVFWNYCIHRSSLMKYLLKNLFPSHGGKVYSACRQLQDHDERAAFICAITARSAHLGTSFVVNGGWDGAISLPPEQFLQRWAKKSLQARCTGHIKTGRRS